MMRIFVYIHCVSLWQGHAIELVLEPLNHLDIGTKLEPQTFPFSYLITQCYVSSKGCNNFKVLGMTWI